MRVGLSERIRASRRGARRLWATHYASELGPLITLLAELSRAAGAPARAEANTV